MNAKRSQTTGGLMPAHRARPQGKEHKPSATEECQMLLIEPDGVVNTGETGGKLTAQNDVWI